MTSPEATKRYLLFPGCLASIRLPRLEHLARRILPELGIELADAKGFSCCPDPVRFTGADRLTARVLSARNLSIAAEAKLPIITLCPSCTLTLASAGIELREDAGLRTDVNNVLAGIGRELKEIPTVTHFLKVLYEDLGTDRLRRAVQRPLSGLALSYHSGCHENSPPGVMGYDNPFNPRKSEELLGALGVSVVDYREKYTCCGSPLMLDARTDDSLKAVVRKTEDMRVFGAGGVVVGCASCFQQFETGQALARRKGFLEREMPVFHFIEVLALAMGHSLRDIGFASHKIKGGGTVETALGEEHS